MMYICAIYKFIVDQQAIDAQSAEVANAEESGTTDMDIALFVVGGIICLLLFVGLLVWSARKKYKKYTKFDVIT